MFELLDSIRFRNKNFYIFDIKKLSFFAVFENKKPLDGKILVGLNKKTLIKRVYNHITIC